MVIRGGTDGAIEEGRIAVGISHHPDETGRVEAVGERLLTSKTGLLACLSPRKAA